MPPPSHPSSLLELPRRPVSTRGEGERRRAASLAPLKGRRGRRWLAPLPSNGDHRLRGEGSNYVEGGNGHVGLRKGELND